MDNMELWNKVSKPPLTALKQIKGGRTSGMTDISPQWRYLIMTETYGPCGIGWKFTVDKKWREEGSEAQIMCFADITLYVKTENGWSEGIPGSGGSMLVEKESKGMHTSDEGYKMAVTDALSVAMKMLGVAAEIYLGNFDGSKYRTGNPPAESHTKDPPPAGTLTAVQTSILRELGEYCKGDESEMDMLLKDLTKLEKNGTWVFLKLEQVRNPQYNTESWAKAFGVALGKLRAKVKAESGAAPNPLIARIDAALTTMHGDDEAAKLATVEGMTGKKEWRDMEDKNLEVFATLLEVRIKDNPS